MSIEENKATVQRIFGKANATQYLAAIDKVLAPDYVRHWSTGEDVRGLEVWRQIWGAFYIAFPEIEWIIDDMVAERDKVAVRFTGRGLQQGEFAGIGAPGKRMMCKGNDVFRLADNKIVEDWSQVQWMEDTSA
jgi:predicted ester cyclase